MTATRAIEAAIERLSAVADEECRLQGALSEAASSAREVPHQLSAAIRKLASTGALQRRWDALRERAESSSETPEDALLSTVLGVLDEVGVIVGEILGQREMTTRARGEAVGAERRTLEWVVGEAQRDSRTPPAMEPATGEHEKLPTYETVGGIVGEPNPALLVR